jgi:predicted porin
MGAYTITTIKRLTATKGDLVRPACTLTLMLAASGSCLAQSSLDLYGTVDASLRGREALGGGWAAPLRLEGGIKADTGAQAKSGRLFERQAWTGLETPYGTVMAGRQPPLLSDALIPVDRLGKRYASFNPNINVAGLSTTAYAEADYTTWRGNAAGATAGIANARHGSGLTLGLMQKF